jgi:hypothetical protein
MTLLPYDKIQDESEGIGEEERALRLLNEMERNENVFHAAMHFTSHIIERENNHHILESSQG